MKKTHALLLVAAVSMLLCAPVSADVLELKKGTLLKGAYEGGTAGTVRFKTTDGIQVVPTDEIVALTFTDAPAATAPAPAPPAPPAASVPAQPATGATAPANGVTVPAGTVLVVRTVDPVSSKDYSGKRFAAKLDADVAVLGSTVVKAGTTVYGKVGPVKQAGRLAGKSEFVISLTEFVIDGKTVPVVTGGFGLVGQGEGKKTVGGAALGAGLGAALGGNRNAAGKGAAIGAAATALKPGQTVQLPPGSLIEFTLSQPAIVPPAK